MFVAPELIRSLETVGTSSISGASDFDENDKVEVLFKGLYNKSIRIRIWCYHCVFRQRNKMVPG